MLVVLGPPTFNPGGGDGSTPAAGTPDRDDRPGHRLSSSCGSSHRPRRALPPPQDRDHRPCCRPLVLVVRMQVAGAAAAAPVIVACGDGRNPHPNSWSWCSVQQVVWAASVERVRSTWLGTLLLERGAVRVAGAEPLGGGGRGGGRRSSEPWRPSPSGGTVVAAATDLSCFRWRRPGGHGLSLPTPSIAMGLPSGQVTILSPTSCSRCPSSSPPSRHASPPRPGARAGGRRPVRDPVPGVLAGDLPAGRSGYRCRRAAGFALSFDDYIVTNFNAGANDGHLPRCSSGVHRNAGRPSRSTSSAPSCSSVPWPSSASGNSSARGGASDQEGRKRSDARTRVGSGGVGDAVARIAARRDSSRRW